MVTTKNDFYLRLAAAGGAGLGLAQPDKVNANHCTQGNTEPWHHPQPDWRLTGNLKVRLGLAAGLDTGVSPARRLMGKYGWKSHPDPGHSQQEGRRNARLVVSKRSIQNVL